MKYTYIKDFDLIYNWSGAHSDLWHILYNLTSCGRFVFGISSTDKLYRLAIASDDSVLATPMCSNTMTFDSSTGTLTIDVDE